MKNTNNISVHTFCEFKLISKEIVDAYEKMYKSELIDLRNEFQLQLKDNPNNELLKEYFKASSACYYKKEYPLSWKERLNEITE